MYIDENALPPRTAIAPSAPAVIQLSSYQSSVPASTHASHPTVRPAQRVDIEALQQLGIDDLAKFRMVAYLCDHPTLWAPAEHFAAALGFHSVARTQVMLEELAAHGIVRRVSASPGSHSLYGLAVSASERTRLAELCRQATDSPGLRSYLARLADRSLARLRRERSRRGKKHASAGEPRAVICRAEDLLPQR